MFSVTIATNNRHKLDEIQAILNNGIVLKTLKDIGCYEELAEDQDTIEGNSLQKADYVFSHYHVDCFADDTGLEVEALNGAPGVISAMYAGPQRSAEDNINLLLKNLEGKPSSARTLQNDHYSYFKGKGSHVRRHCEWNHTYQWSW